MAGDDDARKRPVKRGRSTSDTSAVVQAARDAARAAKLAAEAALEASAVAAQAARAIEDAKLAARETQEIADDLATSETAAARAAAKTRGPKRVVIVGGGCAGMAAAWELAKQPGYEIHLYEKSPRLGGKGSSTRDMTDGRILEHGLHVWMGWYENAFRMMRECYAIVEDNGWGPDEPKPASPPPSEVSALRGRAKPKPQNWKRLAHGRFDDAFVAEPNIGLVDPRFHGESVMWGVMFPPNEGRPGTPMTAHDNPFSMASYTLRLMEMAKALMLSIVADMPGPTPGPTRPDARSRSDEILSLDMETPPADSTAALLNRMATLSKAGALTGAAALLQLVTLLEVWLRRQNIGPKAPESTLAIAEAATSQLRKLLRDVAGIDPRLRMKTEVIDLVLTIMVGLFADRVMLREDGLDSLNEYDYRQWLKHHGATKTSLESRFIRSAYDFAFAYEDGDLKKPRLAAGVALRGGLRMFFTYRGAAFYRMCSGMGDAIFAPLYQVLTDWQETHCPNGPSKLRKKPAAGAPYGRGPGAVLKSPVHFHFGYELKAATFDREGRTLRTLGFDVWPQKGDPLEHGAWPEPEKSAAGGKKDPKPKPGWEVLRQRVDPDDPLERTQFDLAIIATGISEFEKVFVRDHRRRARKPAPYEAWATTCEETKTTATKAAQVWLDRSLYDLGWRHGSGLFACLGEDNFDTYADMTHLIPAERRFPAVPPVRAVGEEATPVPPMEWRSIAYFCNPTIDKTTEAGVNKDLRKLITEQMDHFWPDLFETTDLAKRQAYWDNTWPEDGKYARVNKTDSERYTLSLPGSISSRISPLDEGIDNMTVAGDWTACGLDCGCVEAAVISGMLAATAISGRPKLSDIVGYDQP